MQRFNVSRAATLIVALVAVVAAGCVKKAPTSADPAFMPEGNTSSEARLIVHAEIPSNTLIYIDLPPIGPDAGDSLVGMQEVWRNAPGSNNMFMLDQTPASRLEVFRQEGNGAWLSYKDFLYEPTRKWLDGQMQAFVIVDDAPSAASPPAYLTRGIVNGEATTSSPLSNVGTIANRTISSVVYTGIPAPADSLFEMSWLPVPGAVGYWIQIYQFLEAQQSDQITSGAPQPMYIDKSRDFFVGYVAAPATSYKLGSATGADIFHEKIILRGQVYYVRISAVDVEGRLIAYTFGDFGVAFQGDGYILFPLGAQAINVRAGNGPQAAPTAAMPAGIDLMADGLPIVRRR